MKNLDLFDGADYRDAMVFAQSEYLEMAEEPIADPITGATIELATTAGLLKGQKLAAAGKDTRDRRADQRSGHCQRYFRGDHYGHAGACAKATRANRFRSTPTWRRRPTVRASKNCSAPATPVQSSKAFRCASRR